MLCGRHFVVELLLILVCLLLREFASPWPRDALLRQFGFQKKEKKKRREANRKFNLCSMFLFPPRRPPSTNSNHVMLKTEVFFIINNAFL